MLSSQNQKTDDDVFGFDIEPERHREHIPFDTYREVHTGYVPRAWQMGLSRDMTRHRFSAVVVHRRGGKTVMMVNMLIVSALANNRGNARYAYVAPFMKQAKQVAWDYIKQYSHMIPGVIYNESELSVTFPNGAKIRLYGSDNADAMRGLFFDGVVLDEYADMKPQVWGEVLRPTLTDHLGWAIFIGTPKGVDSFYDLYHRAVLSDDWLAATLLPDDTQAISKRELALAKESMSESQYRQEFLCDWNASSDNTLMPIDEIIAATERGKHLTPEHLFGLPKILGVDVARFGADRSSIVRRWGQVVYKPKVYQDVNNMDLVGLIGQEIQAFGEYGDGEPVDAIFVDAGRGEGVIDRLGQLGHAVIPVDFGGKASNPRYANKRSEMYDVLAKWLATDGCIPNDTELIHDMAALTYSFNASNRMLLEPKDDMKKRGLRSPDVSDSLAVTFAFPVAARGSHTGKGARVQQFTDGGRRSHQRRERRVLTRHARNA